MRPNVASNFLKLSTIYIQRISIDQFNALLSEIVRFCMTSNIGIENKIRRIVHRVRRPRTRIPHPPYPRGIWIKIADESSAREVLRTTAISNECTNVIRPEVLFRVVPPLICFQPRLHVVACDELPDARGLLIEATGGVTR